MNIFKYTHFNKNSVPRQAGLNLDNVVNFIFNQDELGKITACQVLMNAPAINVWREIADKAKIGRDGQILVNRHGYQEITFIRKQEQNHLIINLLTKDDILRFAEIVGTQLNQEDVEGGVPVPDNLTEDLSLDVQEPETELSDGDYSQPV